MYKANYLPYIFPFLLIPCAIIFLVQGRDSHIGTLYCINLLCGGLANVYLVIYQIYHRRKKEDIPRNPTWVYWLNLLTVFQLWPLIPLYLHLPKMWAEKINKLCKFILVAFGIYIVGSIIISIIGTLI